MPTASRSSGLSDAEAREVVVLLEALEKRLAAIEETLRGPAPPPARPELRVIEGGDG